jgi:sterol 3beta-glucosyltransferase
VWRRRFRRTRLQLRRQSLSTETVCSPSPVVQALIPGKDAEMRITILAAGSRGDVQPYVALGMGLQKAGHEVRLVASSDFEAFIKSRGLGFFSAGVDMRRLLQAEEAQATLASERSTLRGLWQTIREWRPAIQQVHESMWQASQETQAIVFSTLGMGAYHVAERLGVPCFWALTFPMFGRTRTQPNPLLPALPLGGGYNLLTHVFVERFWQQLAGRASNSWRQAQLDLPPIPLHKWPYTQLHGRSVPLLYGYSPTVAARPPDWSDHAHVTGYWFLDHSPDWQPSEHLAAFLDSGPPPVYVGFGSMNTRDPQGTSRIVLDALKRSGQRGVIATGWGGLSESDLPDEVFVVESVPHDWLFPRMAAVVHHGGAGTTGAGLRAGVPSIVVPFAGDQPFWARRVKALGVGPDPIARSHLTSDGLADAIGIAVTSEPIRRRAARLGHAIRAEDGIGNAVRVFSRNVA